MDKRRPDARHLAETAITAGSLGAAAVLGLIGGTQSDIFPTLGGVVFGASLVLGYYLMAMEWREARL